MSPNIHLQAGASQPRQIDWGLARRYLLALCFYLALMPTFSLAQTLSTLRQSSSVQLSGGMYFGTQFYQVSGLQDRAAPFQFVANGRMNLQLLEEFNIPISFAIGRQRPNLNFPVFRQFGLSPRYKWLQLHAGYRNMHFGQFTLNNHTFLGGGLEINPGQLRLAGMWGRLRQGRREVEQDIDLFFSQPLYNRFAWGGRAGWGTDASHLDIIYFRAEDRTLGLPLSDSLGIPPPAENIVLGLAWKQEINDQLRLYAEAAASGFNRNRESGIFPVEDYRGARLVETLFTPRFSTQTGLAIKGGADYRLRAFHLGFDYERIDPGFESMGTYFLNGDWENIRGSLGFGLFKGSFRLQTSLGVQRNNLYEQRAETNRRLIGSGNIHIMGKGRWNLALNYSNFNQDNRPSALVILNDTLRIASTTENIGGSWSISSKGAKDRPMSTLTANLNYQQTQNDNPLSENFDDLGTLFAALNYSYRLSNQQTTFLLGSNFSRIDVAERLTDAYGFTLGFRQQLANKRGQISLNHTFNFTQLDGLKDGNSHALRGNINWQVGKLHSLQLGFSWLKRSSLQGFNFNENRGQIGYGLTFPVLKTKAKAAAAS